MSMPAQWRTAALLAAGLLLALAAPSGAGAQADDDHYARPGPAPDLTALGTNVLPSSSTYPDALAATDTLTPDQDTFVSSAQPDTNFGGSSRLYVGEKSPYGATRASVQFDVTDIPRNRAVTDAAVRLYLREAGPSGDGGRNIPIYRVNKAWDEATATWNRCNDCVDRERLDQVNMGTAAGWYEWDAKDLVRRWRWPSWQDWHYDNYGIGVQGYETAGSFRGFDSSEGSNDPQLEVVHEADTRAPTSRAFTDRIYYNVPDSGKDYATIKVNLEGTDPEPATGIDYFWAVLKINNGGFNGLTDPDNNPPSDFRKYSFNYRGYNGKIYNFVSYATDMAGNREPNKPNPDVIVHVDWSAPAITLNPLPPYVKGNFDLAWTGGDLPTGNDIYPSGLAYYTIWFNVNNTSWGIWLDNIAPTTTTMFFDKASNYSSYQFQVVGTDKAGNHQPVLNAQTQTFVDNVAPNATMQPVDKPLAQTSFTVGWSGNDGPGSGVATYDVQYRIGLGPWQPWQTATTATSAGFQGQMGNNYSFRARATDKAGNAGAFPEASQLNVIVIQPSALIYKLLFPWVGK